MLNFNRDFMMGFVSGAVCGAVGYKLYEENKGELQNLIHSGAGHHHHFAPPASANGAPSLEELVAQKERLEDLIAEKSLA